MTDKEKFRKEVEKLKSNLIYGACSSQIAMETMCKEEAYNEVLAILDTLQEEPVSEDLEEDINKEWRCYSKDNDAACINKFSFILIARHFANWQKEKEYTCYEEAFEDGAKWKNEQMMAKAVDGEVTYGKSLAIPSLGWVLDKERLDFGDKVKLIIIKED